MTSKYHEKIRRRQFLVVLGWISVVAAVAVLAFSLWRSVARERQLIDLLVECQEIIQRRGEQVGSCAEAVEDIGTRIEEINWRIRQKEARDGD